MKFEVVINLTDETSMESFREALKNLRDFFRIFGLASIEIKVDVVFVS